MREAASVVESWGRLLREPHSCISLHHRDQAPRTLQSTRPGIARGAGRSYGDVALNPGGKLWTTAGLDRLIRFDPVRGILTCESGALLGSIQRWALKSGWRLPVMPGTQVVSVGGAIANDVHGKNQHVAGSFGNHVIGLRLGRTDGQVMDIAPQRHADWLTATVGGLGLTGVILDVDLQLRPVAGPWLDVESLPFSSLDEFFELASAAEREGWEHSVAWVDCVAPARRGRVRGIFERANWAQEIDALPPGATKLRMPITPPISLVNSLSLRVFNQAYYHLHRWKAGRAVVYQDAFLAPLDRIQDWNRIYGRRGFYQYQSVVPCDVGRDAIAAMLDLIARSGQGSFLAVLKMFGNPPPVGMLSFVRPGVTLALDFPNRGDATLALLKQLDVIVAEAGGCVYLAKDARWPRARFEAAYTRVHEFQAYRDPGISSAMSRRLMGA